MIERAVSADARGHHGPARARDGHRPGRRAAEADADVRGEEAIVVDGADASRAAATSCCAPSANRNAQDHLLEGRSATIERIYIDYDDAGPPLRDRRRRPRPGPHARHRPVPVLQARRGGGRSAMTPRSRSRSSSPGVGNAWLQDDAFGGECARRLEARGVPDGVTVMDFGTGGLDLAYELMRGYDALVLLDASRQGGEPGTLYVVEPDMAEFAARDRGRRGHQPARHGPRRRCCASSARSAASPARSSSSAASRARSTTSASA